MKTLVIRLSSSGDILLCSDVIKAIKAMPGGRADIMVKKGFADAAKAAGADKVIEIDFKKPGALKQAVITANTGNYDAILDLHSNFRSNYIELMSGVPVKAAYKKDVLKRRLMVAFKWFLGSGMDVRKRYMEAAVKAGIKEPAKARKAARKLPKRLKIVIHAGAKWQLKRWPHFAELAKLLAAKKHKVTLTGVAKEVENDPELLYIKGRGISNLIGRTDFKRLYSVIKGSDLFAGNDTAAAHIAAICGVPAVVIMGPTVKQFGFICGDRYTVVERGMACRPCGLHGEGKCLIGTHGCMKEITPEEVAGVLGKLKIKN